LKIIAIIPAHLKSIRFPKKIIFPILGLPMIEHVRRRALISNVFSEVYVATCDKKIANLIINNNGKVILTSKKHKNGTSRVAEAIKNIDCTHVVLIQGDEPLILPNQIKLLNKKIKLFPHVDSWNAVGTLEKKKELNKHSFVKCIINKNNSIIKCFRFFFKLSENEKKEKNIKKILGLIAFRKKFLLKISKKPLSINEKKDLIEQMRIIDNGHKIKSILIKPTLPSVNEPDDLKIIHNYIKKNNNQKLIIKKILDWKI
tara:strand:+ start:185 stop:958 length:774 start_codon:yes stop_codon:yes gene_type:complete